MPTKQNNPTKPGRRSTYVPVKTIDLFSQPKPATYASLSYIMSTPDPLQDPCAYANAVSGPSQPQKPANRISIALAASYEETEKLRFPNMAGNKKKANDPALKLAKSHDIEGFKQNMTIDGVPVLQFQAHHKSRASNVAASAASASSTGEAQDESMTDTTVLGNEDMATSTPMRRVHAGSDFDSTAKRQRTMRVSTANTSMDGDVSMDTVRSVLRLVDESLMYTPEKMAASTPKVLRAAPVPSPRNNGPTFAYDDRSSFESYGGLLPKLNAPTPFGVTRI